MSWYTPPPVRPMPGVAAASRARRQQVLNRLADMNPDEMRDARLPFGRGGWLVILIGGSGIGALYLFVLWTLGLL